MEARHLKETYDKAVRPGHVLGFAVVMVGPLALAAWECSTMAAAWPTQGTVEHTLTLVLAFVTAFLCGLCSCLGFSLLRQELDRRAMPNYHAMACEAMLATKGRKVAWKKIQESAFWLGNGIDAAWLVWLKDAKIALVVDGDGEPQVFEGDNCCTSAIRSRRESHRE